MKNIIVVIGAGSIGQAIVRRIGAGKHILLADLRQENADAAAKTLSDAGFYVSITTFDVSSRASVQQLVKKATALGEVSGLIHAAGVSPSQASPETILKVDLYGTALVLEEFGEVIARGGAGVVIASQSGHRLPPLSSEQNAALATTPTEELLKLPMLQPDQVKDSLHAYQISKRGNSLRVMAEAVRWGKRGARVNTISPGAITRLSAAFSKADSVREADDYAEGEWDPTGPTVSSPVVAWLGSDEAAHVSGMCLRPLGEKLHLMKGWSEERTITTKKGWDATTLGRVLGTDIFCTRTPGMR